MIPPSGSYSPISGPQGGATQVAIIGGISITPLPPAKTPSTPQRLQDIPKTITDIQNFNLPDGNANVIPTSPTKVKG